MHAKKILNVWSHTENWQKYNSYLLTLTVLPLKKVILIIFIQISKVYSLFVRSAGVLSCIWQTLLLLFLLFSRSLLLLLFHYSTISLNCIVALMSNVTLTITRDQQIFFWVYFIVLQQTNPFVYSFLDYCNDGFWVPSLLYWLFL